MPWYQMPAKYQKHVLCIIHDAQNGAVLTMGPLGDLDFEMGTSVSGGFILILKIHNPFSFFYLTVYSTDI